MLEKLRNNYSYILLTIGVLYAVGRYFYKKPSVINGETAPNFTSIKIDGEAFDLSTMRGQYILLDFWGSWCGPCIAEKKFKDAKNFDIVSFGVEKDRARWAATIQQLDMNHWQHISDFKYLESPVTVLYGVRVIPTKILLNTEGVIIGVNLPMEEMEKLLNEKMIE
jgi:thiol-disulfide isomerase/thioredoxin